MPRTETVGPNNECIVKWTDSYGTEIKEGSLITYAVRRSGSMNTYRALVTRVDSRYIYVLVDDNSYWRNWRKLSNNRKARLYATSTIIVYGQLKKALVDDGDDLTLVAAILHPNAVPEVQL